MALAGVGHRSGLELIVRNCQELAGLMVANNPSAVVQQLHRITTAIPEDPPVPERFAIQQIVTQTVCRVVVSADIDKHRDVARACIRWMASSSDTNAWSTELMRLIDTCETLISSRGTHRVKSAPSVHSRRALALVARRFSDPGLNLRAVAADCRLSVWHAARMIKRETGISFLAHVHHARVQAAARLLAESTLTVKEIAAAVGYGSSSQLGRHFRRLHATTPHAFREDAHRRQILTAKTREQ
jgi:AraC-like DNA-binding protein